VPRGPALIYEGTCEGLIAEEISGNQGFGYDPLFYYPPLKRTFAQMSATEKNSVSHRGRAMAELKGELDKVLTWLRQRLAEEPF
jgi:XTP/dITP diphosphohydrolase